MRKFSRYEHVSCQPNRLGKAEFGEFGGEVSAVFDAIGQAVVGVTRALTESKTARTRARSAKEIAVTQAIEATKQADIVARGAKEQAIIEVHKVKTTFGSISNLILGLGASLAVVMLSGGIAYKVATKRK